LVFFDTGDEVLLKRYADTRRRHPLSHLGLALADAIARERQVLKPLRALADAIIDPRDLNVHQLRRRVTPDINPEPDTRTAEATDGKGCVRTGRSRRTPE